MWPPWNICLFCWQRIEIKNQTQSTGGGQCKNLCLFCWQHIVNVLQGHWRKGHSAPFGRFYRLPGSRVRPFCFKKFFAYNRNKAKLDPFLMCSLVHYKISLPFFSLLFAYFCFKFFASLRFSNFHFEIFASHKKKPLNFASIQYFSHYFATQFCFKWKTNIFIDFFA